VAERAKPRKITVESGGSESSRSGAKEVSAG
jgi:hypothetical protein